MANTLSDQGKENRIKIYDCFIFFNEVELLYSRLAYLKNEVDIFVVVEASKTFQGADKPFNYELNKSRFEEFSNKIRYIKVEDMPLGPDPWVREHFQRDAIGRGLYDAGESDWIIISDCDEIPRKSQVKNLKAIESSTSKFIFATPVFFFRLNYMMISPIVRHTNVVAVQMKDFLGAQAERNAGVERSFCGFGYKDKSYEIIEHAGWHFSYFGNEEVVKKKLGSFSHTEGHVKEILSWLNVDEIVKKRQGLMRDQSNEIFEVVRVTDYFDGVDRLFSRNSTLDAEELTNSVQSYYPENCEPILRRGALKYFFILKEKVIFYWRLENASGFGLKKVPKYIYILGRESIKSFGWLKK